MNFTVSDEDLTALGERLVGDGAGGLTHFVVAHGELNLHGAADRIVEVLTRLRDDPECPFEQLIDLCGVDYPQRPKRFEIGRAHV